MGVWGMGAVLAGLYALLYVLSPPETTTERPLVALSNYVRTHPPTPASLPLSDILIEEHTLTAQASCASAKTMGDLRAAMAVKLADLHPDLLSRVLARAFVPSLVVNHDKLQHTVTSMGTTGEAGFYIARWHTVQNEHNVETCVTAGSFHMRAADVIVGMNVTTTAVKLGEEEACRVAYGKVKMGCKRVAVYGNVTNSVPIFRKHALPPQGLDQLTAMMEGRCVDAARQLTGVSELEGPDV